MVHMAPYARVGGTLWMPLSCARVLDMQEHWLLWEEPPMVQEVDRYVGGGGAISGG